MFRPAIFHGPESCPFVWCGWCGERAYACVRILYAMVRDQMYE